VSRIAWAQAYPSRPVRIIVGFAAGGGTDIAARLTRSMAVGASWPTIHCRERPGAGSNIATEAVVNARPDGYTLLLVSTAHAINATLYDNLSFTFIRDIVPIASMTRQPQVMLANPSLPAKTVPEFIAYAKANPGKINMASGGNGTASHVSGELFKIMTGVNMVHVPYRGAAPALTDLIGGQIQIMFENMPSSIEHIRTGKLGALAVTDIAPGLLDATGAISSQVGLALFGVSAPKEHADRNRRQANFEINAELADQRSERVSPIWATRHLQALRPILAADRGNRSGQGLSGRLLIEPQPGPMPDQCYGPDSECLSGMTVRVIRVDLLCPHHVRLGCQLGGRCNTGVKSPLASRFARSRSALCAWSRRYPRNASRCRSVDVDRHALDGGCQHPAALSWRMIGRAMSSYGLRRCPTPSSGASSVELLGLRLEQRVISGFRSCAGCAAAQT
jgi:hypothetical protein